MADLPPTSSTNPKKKNKVPWSQRLELLHSHINPKTGQVRLSASHVDSSTQFPLGAWWHSIQTQGPTALTAAQRRDFKAAGIPLPVTTNNKKKSKAPPPPPSCWDEWFQLLVDYQSEYYHCSPPTDLIYRNQPLGAWAASMRRAYSSQKQTGSQKVMTPAQVARLKAIGFKWRVTGSNPQGDSETTAAAPSRNKEIEKKKKKTSKKATTVTTVKAPAEPKASKATSRPPDSAKKSDSNVDDNGDDADTTNNNNNKKKRQRGTSSKPVTWDEWFELLLAYQKEKHHLSPSNKELFRGRKLGNWVSNQRQAFSRFQRGIVGVSSKMSETRVARLDEIGFVWRRREQLLEQQQAAAAQSKGDDAPVAISSASSASENSDSESKPVEAPKKKKMSHSEKPAKVSSKSTSPYKSKSTEASKPVTAKATGTRSRSTSPKTTSAEKKTAPAKKATVKKAIPSSSSVPTPSKTSVITTSHKSSKRSRSKSPVPVPKAKSAISVTAVTQDATEDAVETPRTVSLKKRKQITPVNTETAEIFQHPETFLKVYPVDDLCAAGAQVLSRLRATPLWEGVALDDLPANVECDLGHGDFRLESKLDDAAAAMNLVSLMNCPVVFNTTTTTSTAMEEDPEEEEEMEAPPPTAPPPAPATPDLMTPPGELPWKEKVAALRRYLATHGNLDLPKKYLDPVTGYDIADWAQALVKQSLPPHHVLELDAMGIIWTNNETNKDISQKMPWESWFELLMDFRRVHHHSSPGHAVVFRGKNLGRWASNQRNAYSRQQRGKEGKNASIPPERVVRLNAIGFVWKLGKACARGGLPTAEANTVTPIPEVTVPQTEEAVPSRKKMRFTKRGAIEDGEDINDDNLSTTSSVTELTAATASTTQESSSSGFHPNSDAEKAAALATISPADVSAVMNELAAVALSELNPTAPPPAKRAKTAEEMAHEQLQEAATAALLHQYELRQALANQALANAFLPSPYSNAYGLSDPTAANLLHQYYTGAGLGLPNHNSHHHLLAGYHSHPDLYGLLGTSTGTSGEEDEDSVAPPPPPPFAANALLQRTTEDGYACNPDRAVQFGGKQAIVRSFY
uniref:Helicase-associated domain-containing protein n=1 Tax=Entomoneis paludosa TaxID=265537 RepID=A0A7S2YFV4_9STRA|mmetsp:Transcript_31374/g.65493  ORF Transcript_31374/g.65493 Transcript_31374/m.65493 type:complete len:1080 (+) Transcript_31374:206-3445(+)|eukprot:CAMPEP_0172449462 /NCGR_PEP_ID=MMETSP1065-20121228/8164_1 /TAXON_ID=265537 /ORGANISM="Amphiprora paludosa, Strain CCMP125" /LENGTH=1079 /DNA_ID=CAMNT_0013201145 /DNA_START=172 /DNA_END=3411 /DNA_ORIENTATION=+